MTVRSARALVKLLLCVCLHYSGVTALIARWFPRRRPAILCAHRVVERDDPFFPGIARERFAAEVAWLARHHRVLPLADVIDAMLAGRTLPRGTVALTFDDGFADNFEVAYPILRRYGLPATIFLVGESIETGRLPWPDRLAYLLQRTERTTVDITVPEPRTFFLRSQQERLEALDVLRTLLKTSETEVRRRAMEELEASLSVGPDRGMMLTWEQCRRMAESGISFGAHTLTHPILPLTEAHEVKHEIVASRALIESRLGVRIRYFAYPNDESSSAAVQAVEAAGFDAAVAGVAREREAPVDRYAVGRSPWSLAPVSVFVAKVTGVLDSLTDVIVLLC